MLDGDYICIAVTPTEPRGSFALLMEEIDQEAFEELQFKQITALLEHRLAHHDEPRSKAYFYNAGDSHEGIEDLRKQPSKSR